MLQTLNIFISRAQNQESKPQQLMWSPAHLQDHQLLLVFQQTRTATMPYLLGQLLLLVVWAGISCLNQRNLQKSQTEASLWLKIPQTLLLVLFVNRIVRWVPTGLPSPSEVGIQCFCSSFHPACTALLQLFKAVSFSCRNKFRFFCNELHLVSGSFMWRVASFFYGISGICIVLILCHSAALLVMTQKIKTAARGHVRAPRGDGSQILQQPLLQVTISLGRANPGEDWFPSLSMR